MGRIDIPSNDPHETYRGNHVGHRKDAPPEAWYSVVTEMNAVGNVVNETEADTKESLILRFWRDCRRHQGVACMKRSTQELAKPC